MKIASYVGFEDGYKKAAEVPQVIVAGGRGMGRTPLGGGRGLGPGGGTMSGAGLGRGGGGACLPLIKHIVKTESKKEVAPEDKTANSKKKKKVKV